jgi:hypothetical protein
MPNHVRNVLQFDGKRGEIDRLLGHVKSEDSAFDFNTIIPMPKTLDIVSGSRTNLGLEAVRYLDTGNIPDEHSHLPRWWRQEEPSLSLEQYIGVLVERGQCDLNLGEIARDNLRDHGYATWYEWACDNWGTKWNAYSIETAENSITFDTAWAAPVMVMNKLAGLFPNVEITHYWADEDAGGNCGHTVYHNGGTKVEILFDHSSRAYEIYVLCWGESDWLDRDADGNWHPVDDAAREVCM